MWIRHAGGVRAVKAFAISGRLLSTRFLIVPNTITPIETMSVTLGQAQSLRRYAGLHRCRGFAMKIQRLSLSMLLLFRWLCLRHALCENPALRLAVGSPLARCKRAIGLVAVDV